MLRWIAACVECTDLHAQLLNLSPKTNSVPHSTNEDKAIFAPHMHVVKQS